MAPVFEHPIPGFPGTPGDENDEGVQPENHAVSDDWALPVRPNYSHGIPAEVLKQMEAQ